MKKKKLKIFIFTVTIFYIAAAFLFAQDNHQSKTNPSKLETSRETHSFTGRNSQGV